LVVVFVAAVVVVVFFIIFLVHKASNRVKFTGIVAKILLDKTPFVYDLKTSWERKKQRKHRAPARTKRRPSKTNDIV